MTEYSRWDVNESATIDPAAFEGGDWHMIDDTRPGPGGAGRFYVRVARGAGGRLVITGLLMGGDAVPSVNGPHVGEQLTEIDANTLRAVKPAEILRTIRWRESGSPPPRSVGEIEPTGLTGLARHEGMTERIAARARPQAGVARRGRRGATDADLEEFAAAYRRHWEYAGSRAMGLTARDLHMDRSTANRRFKRCRAEGLDLGRTDAQREAGQVQ